ncbi:MAG: VWA domain-containing protein [Myxococcus sp.]|nr:VWA domain-containing protein [Myxococcus sp.]
MSFVAPQALLLLLPLGLLLWRTGRWPGPPMWLRGGLVAALVVALAQPEWRLASDGSDLVVIVDRSRSMPSGSLDTATELIRLLEGQRRPGDRLGVLSFGRQVRVEAPLSADARFGGFSQDLDAEASNLSTALDAAADLIPQERAGRVLVLSDGRATGLDPRASARRLAARGVPVDVRPLVREDAALDVAVTGLEAPPAVTQQEPFLLTATVKTNAAAEATLTLLRNGKPITTTTRALPEGPMVLTFRDLVEAPGLVAYQLRVTAKGDGLPENDVGRAVVRVDGPPSVLLLTDRPTGVVAQTLRAAGMTVDARLPFALGMEHLENVGAVVLEDVEASRLSEAGLQVLAQYVREAGGGLVMTGGRHAFGEGGYRKSPLEPVLPVSLEVREEQRKASVAISIIMDCSCSMGATVPDGRTKMELAAEGVVGALQLLNERDEASVHMVDTSDHELFGLRSVASGLPLDTVARGFSGGGGIYVDVGLRVAKNEILRSGKPTRHVLLFSDAADSEQPGDYKATLDALVAQDVTVSVIGLGTRADSDALLLEEIAARGNGRIYFAEDATSLPRIFSQETIAVARSSFVDGDIALAPGPDLAMLGRIPTAGLSSCGGYSLTYLKPNASVGVRTTDDNKAPLLAFWPHGLGRSVALTGEVDGKYTGKLSAWAGLRAALEQSVRWAMPPLATSVDAVARARLAGNDLHVTLDFDPSAPPPSGQATLVLLSGDAKVKPVELPMRWEDEDRQGAHFVLPGTGTWHPVVKLGDRVFRAPPVTLPWVPEFEPAPPRAGRDALVAVAKAGSGVERLAMAGLFGDGPQSFARVPLAPFLMALAVMLVVAEVFVRRFLAGPKARRPRPAVPPVVAAAPVAEGRAPSSAPVAEGPAPTNAAAPVAVAAAPSEPKRDALTEARERARKRTQR